MNNSKALRAIRGRLFWFSGDPATSGNNFLSFFEDGMIIIQNGLIIDCGDYSDMSALLDCDSKIDDVRPNIVMPGFIDTHIHFPQTQVIASYGSQLLEWLNRYTFVEEQKFSDEEHSTRIAKYFIDTLLRNGTTTAVAFGSVHPQSVSSFFLESSTRNTRMLCGKVMMDRNAPPGLRDTAETGYAESKALIERWHGHGRQHYAIAPRFAITSSEAQLEAAGALRGEYPDCYVQTHLSENKEEIETVRQLFPKAKDYTDVYDHYGLLGEKSLFGHCIHLSNREIARLSESSSVAVHCPTSNLFLGSGLFNWRRLRADGVRVGIATDVGAGTSYSMLKTLGEAYKIQLLQGNTLNPLDAFHAITRGNAIALGLEKLIGTIAPGMEADLIVLDSSATPEMAHRMETVNTLEEELFVLMTLGDDRAIKSTYIMGKIAVKK